MSLDINKLMSNFGQMPDIINKVQEELGKVKVEGSAGAGMVTVELNGRGEALSVNIQQEAMDNGAKFLEDLLVAAINDAANKRESAKMETLKSFSGLEGMLGNI